MMPAIDYKLLYESTLAAKQELDAQHKLLGDEVKRLKAERDQLEQWLSQLERITGTYIPRGQEVLRAEHPELYKALDAQLSRLQKGGAA